MLHKISIDKPVMTVLPYLKPTPMPRFAKPKKITVLNKK
jgi:hypothetical protein